MNKIYILDSNVFYLASLESLFRSRGFEVLASHGEHGLEHSHKGLHLNRPDLIVMDLDFRHFNGLELLHKIQGDDHLNHAPVAIYTAKTNRHLLTPSAERGASHFFVKEEYLPERLMDRMQKIYKR